jgi:ATP-dependent DNA helicase HFM1/MER3
MNILAWIVDLVSPSIRFLCSHLLNEEQRGATLEGLLSRMQMRKAEASRDIPDPSKRDAIGNLRILALSATAPNAADVATWLHGIEFSFDNAHRPVPIEYFVYDYALRGGNFFAFEHSLNSRLIELIRRHSDNRPTLIFNSTRKNAEQAAKAVSDSFVKLGLLNTIITTDRQRQRYATDKGQ